ncbi:MAG: DUF3024 domain-containing protein [Verrucomicrobia bacterium]|nr:DUF3024 domain-containing protein [Verrucomicrobiota bacterium]
MALPFPQLQECLAAVGALIEKRRPRPEIRDKLDYRADITGSCVTLLSVRPSYQNKAKKTEHPVARARWVGTQREWRLYWMRADLKWHRYQPLPSAPTIAEIFDEVQRDPYGCFFG